MDSGLKPVKFIDQERLRVMLDRFKKQLENTSRKRYEPPRAAERAAVQGLAQQLLCFFELTSPSLLCHFADMVEFPCSLAAAERCIDRARAERVNMIIGPDDDVD